MWGEKLFTIIGTVYSNKLLDKRTPKRDHFTRMHNKFYSWKLYFIIHENHIFSIKSEHKVIHENHMFSIKSEHKVHYYISASSNCPSWPNWGCLEHLVMSGACWSSGQKLSSTLSRIYFAKSHGWRTCFSQGTENCNGQQKNLQIFFYYN